MYYICKFSDSWSVYDEKKRASRTLEKNEIELLKTLFPALLDDHTKILAAVQVSAIKPNKLMTLGSSEQRPTNKHEKTAA